MYLTTRWSYGIKKIIWEFIENLRWSIFHCTGVSPCNDTFGSHQKCRYKVKLSLQGEVIFSIMNVIFSIRNVIFSIMNVIFSVMNVLYFNKWLLGAIIYIWNYFFLFFFQTSTKTLICGKFLEVKLSLGLPYMILIKFYAFHKYFHCNYEEGNSTRLKAVRFWKIMLKIN